ncbi:DUF350 domain-containing protein [Candidatus Micrarchaeota archaeon]|nr:DUF350 domain-containing protein [Candidatus Micrarchaeota archaeon]
MVQETVIALASFVIQAGLAMVFSAWALFTTIKVLDKMTAGIEEWEEIKKGNLAVGVFYAVVLLSMSILMWPRIEDILYTINGFTPIGRLLTSFGLSLLNYLVAMIFSISVFYLSINLIDKLTSDMNELQQLKKGNLAVALIMSAILLSIVFLVRIPLEHIFDIIKMVESNI